MNINDLLAPSPAQPDHPAFGAGAQNLQSHFQAPSEAAYDSQWTVPHPLRFPPLEQNAFDTNDDYGSHWHGKQRQYQQHQCHVPPPVAQPLPVAQPNYNPYQPTAGYPQHYDVTSPWPQLAYYPYLQPQQQQQHFYRTPSPQDPRPAKCQRFDGLNLSGLSHHAPLRPQPQFESLLFPTETTGVYPHRTQGLGHGESSGRLINAQLGSNKRGRGAMADWGQGDSFMGPGGEDARVGQSSDGVHAHGSEGNFGRAASMQDEGFNPFPDSAEHVAVPVATQFQGAQHVNISGNTRFIGMSTGNTTVNHYGGTHGLENLKEFVSFAALHDSAEQDPDRCCHPGTRETVLKRLRDWFDNPNPTDRMIWLHGPAGAGKSAIAQTIADQCKERGVAATFFFYRSDPSRNNGDRLFPTIAWQLAFSIPAIKDFIVHALDKTPHLPTKRVETQFEQLVANPFQAMNVVASQMLQPAPVVIIDGVDECSDEQLQRRFLTIIGNAVKNQRVPLRFLIVSRPEALMEETLNKFKDFTVSIDLAKLDDSNRDIQKYLEDKFFEIASNRGLDPTWPGQEIIQEIVFKSSGNFIFASTVIRFVSDEDYEPEFLLNIILNLTPHGNMSPFALLDELFLEILKRQRDQDFLKTFLTLFIGRSSLKQTKYPEDGLPKDDAMLMNVSEKVLHIRLRRMRSLLKFEPFIDVYHKSFLDFLHDPTRSGQYHVSKEGGQKRYLELIVDSVIRHISMAIEQLNCHGTCHSSPEFRWIVRGHPPKIELPVKDWQEALKPLLVLQAKLLQMSKFRSCHITQVMRHLILHLAFLQKSSHPIIAVQALESNMSEAVTEWSPALVTESQQNIPEKDLDSCLPILLSCLQLTDSVMVVDRAIIDHMCSLLVFDYVETAARVRTYSDAQKLIDLIDSLTNNKLFLSHCGRDGVCKAVRLASEIFAKVPLLPQPLLSQGALSRLPSRLGNIFFEFQCQSAFICRILDYDSGIYIHDQNEQQDKSIGKWLGSSPELVTRIKVILDVARTIRYIHSMDVVLYSGNIKTDYIFLNSNLRAKFNFYCFFPWSVREGLSGESQFFADCTYESNIRAFGNLFSGVCFRKRKGFVSNHLVEDARQLIERCRATKNLKRQPTMKDVVTEMETWDLT